MRPPRPPRPLRRRPRRPQRSPPCRRNRPRAFGDVGLQEVSEKDWEAETRKKIAQQQKIDPAVIVLSPGRLRAAFVRSPAVAPSQPSAKRSPRQARRHAPARRHQIIVVDNQGRSVASFRPVTLPGSDEPPKDLSFLAEDRLVYEAVAPTPAPEPPASKKGATGIKRKPKGHGARRAATAPSPPPKPAAPELPPRLLVIQPIGPRARPIRCQGFHFVFSREHDRLAFVGGKPESAYVAVDGAQVYPRSGRTLVASGPAWSKDGHSLAFLESPTGKLPRLVLLAELDNPTGDTTWDLPPTAPLDGTGVFWAGPSKLVVGKTATHPFFSAAFTKDAPPQDDASAR